VFPKAVKILIKLNTKIHNTQAKFKTQKAPKTITLIIIYINIFILFFESLMTSQQDLVQMNGVVGVFISIRKPSLILLHAKR